MKSDQTPPPSPFNAIPPVVVGLFVVIMVIEITLGLGQQGVIGGPGAVGWRVAAIQDFGFSPAVWEQIMRGNWSFDIVKRLFTYAFVHGSFTHAIFAAVLFVALGKFVGEEFHPFAVLAIFGFATVIGAVVYGIIVNRNIPLFGAYPPVYGLIGAYTYILWLRLGQLGKNQLQAFRMIGLLLALQLVFGLLFGSQPTWIADVAGFGAGLALSVLVAPGGWASFVARARNR